MKHGIIAILPLAAGAAVYGFAFGLLAAQVGFPWWGVALMSSFVHAGSSQIVAVEQFAGSSAVIGAALAGAALNLRYIGIVASLSDVLSGLSLRAKLTVIHITGDENWALTMSERAKNPEVGAAFLIGSGLVMISVWTASTTFGAVVGAALPNLEQFGLGFAFNAAFIAMARGLWRGPSNSGPWLVSFVVTVVIVLLGIPKAYAIVAGSVCGLAASYFMKTQRKLPA
ncbi:branched-chain amino acid ABC transporter permease [Parasedimentitalea maritima]|uniref:Branched-chain amino acid ABC transporter permease n=1 Tax=Parasedimentitalea maritima TaxID=2578117 RepID=A0ABY2USN2_9RHOB|nr:AzlC family ABC transporter permease [Zongyanglinia marina]TLP61390.1 branched-chain amino acid ABC transporter permease [Zongyanglinia marina]